MPGMTVTIEIVEDPARACAAMLVGPAAGGGDMVLTGGSTPKAAYQGLVKVVHNVGLDLTETTFWFGDERCVPPDDERSNYLMAKQTLFEPLGSANQPNVRRMRGELGAAEGAEAYERELDAAGPPEFDLLLLGVGPDGHIASMFPDQPSLHERSRLVVGVEQAGLEPFVPRVSMTLPALACARAVVVLATGSAKADAVAAAFGRDAGPDPQVPASMMPAAAKRLTVLARSPAAAERLMSGHRRRPRRAPRSRSRAEGPSSASRDRADRAEAARRRWSGSWRWSTRDRQEDLEAVGLGVPSVVEFETGSVVSSVNVPLADVPCARCWGSVIGVPVFVDNDATVAALAEAHDEQIRLVAHDLVMLTVGTGVGGGLVLGGRIYRGATGGAGELGHTIVGLDLAGAVPAPMGAFPQPGSLEVVAAGHALDHLAAQAAGPIRIGARPAAAPRESPCSAPTQCGGSRRRRGSPDGGDLGRAGRHRHRQCDQHVRSRGGRDRRRRGPGGRAAARAGKRVAPDTCCPGSARAPRSAWPATASGPGCSVRRCWPSTSSRGRHSAQDRHSRRRRRHDHRLRIRPRRRSTARPPAGADRALRARGARPRDRSNGPDRLSRTRRSRSGRRWSRAVPSAGSSCAARAPGSRWPPARSTASARRPSTTPTPPIRRSSTTTSTCCASAAGWSASSWRPRSSRAYLGASFSGEERHVRRLAKVAEIERSGGRGRLSAEMWLVRHGETEWSANGKHTSRTDLPLLDAGRRRAAEIADELAEHDFAVGAVQSAAPRARDLCELAGFGEAARHRARPAGMGLRRVRGADHAGDPRAAAGLVAVARRLSGRGDTGRGGARAPIG